MKPEESRIVLRWESGEFSPSTQDAVAAEEPMEIRVEGRSVAVVMRSPGHDEELAAGFLLSEGIIKRSEDIFDVIQCQTEGGNAVDVTLTDPGKFKPENLTRHVYTTSSCGICGRATIESVMMTFPALKARWTLTPKIVTSLSAKLQKAQTTFTTTGGLHASGLFDRGGNLLLAREDVGRHNALDKVLGHALLNGISGLRLPLTETVLLVSGRISYELVQKGLAGGIPVIAGISAPTTLAVDCAKKSNMTLIGFLRNDRMNVYTHPNRIKRP